MKSNKQKRLVLGAKRQRRVKKTALRSAQKQPPSPYGTVTVNPAALRLYVSYGAPHFVKRGFYVDHPFTCKDCGKEEIWTAAQQKWWYEVAKGEVSSGAVRCRACRKRERDRKTEARRVHLEGVAKKREEK